jgi:hypothetical protein
VQPREPLGSDEPPRTTERSPRRTRGERFSWVPILVSLLGGVLILAVTILTYFVVSLHSDLQEARSDIKKLNERLDVAGKLEVGDRKDLDAEKQKLEDFRRLINKWASGMFTDTCTLVKGDYSAQNTCALRSGPSARFNSPFP